MMNSGMSGQNPAGMQLPGTDPALQAGMEGMAAPQPQPMPAQQPVPQEETYDLRAAVELVNIAEKIDKDDLLAIGEQCKREFEIDLASCHDFHLELREWVKLAKQVKENKSFPWKDASNIKYPLMGIAAMQFSARAYPSLVPSDGQVVKARVVGQDPDGQKALQGNRVSKFMSWQVFYEMPNWEDDMDRLLSTIPITGNMYKKTFFNASLQKPVSALVPVERLVVNYWAKSLEQAERISEILYVYPREVKNRQAMGIYLDTDLGTPTGPEANDQNTPDADTSAIPFELIEQHRYLDLDDDGYEEPYVVTFERNSGKVVRITARFDTDSIREVGNKRVIIEPLHYYTKYGFIPNPDGSFFDLGFGALLGPLNESVNTLVNQLVDAGTLNNLQGGFLGKGLRIRGGDYRFEPGEWKWVNATVDDLKKQILPLPTKEPSAVLMNLLQFLITAGKELASVAEIFVGKMPGQNTPATTTMASIEQGMKVFTAIYKRVYRSLDQEFNKLYQLNKTYFDNETYSGVLDDPALSKADFDSKTYNICPAADPAATTQSEKMAKSQALMELLPLGTIDPVEVTIRILQAQDQPNWEKLIPGMAQTGAPQIPQKQDPKLQEMQMKMQMEQTKVGLKQQEMQGKMAMEQRSKEFEMKMKEQEHHQNLQQKSQEANLDAQIKMHNQKIFAAEAQQKMNRQAVQGQQDLVHREQAHQQNLKQSKETAKSKSAQKTSSSGSRTPSRK